MAFDGYSVYIADIFSGETVCADFPSGRYYELIYWLARHINTRVKRKYVQVIVFEMDTEDGPTSIALDLSIRNYGSYSKMIINNGSGECILFNDEAFVMRHTILTIELDNWIDN